MANTDLYPFGVGGGDASGTGGGNSQINLSYVAGKTAQITWSDANGNVMTNEQVNIWLNRFGSGCVIRANINNVIGTGLLLENVLFYRVTSADEPYTKFSCVLGDKVVIICLDRDFLDDRVLDIDNILSADIPSEFVSNVQFNSKTNILSFFKNGSLTAALNLQLASVATTGAYDDLSGKPVISYDEKTETLTIS